MDALQSQELGHDALQHLPLALKRFRLGSSSSGQQCNGSPEAGKCARAA